MFLHYLLDYQLITSCTWNMSFFRWLLRKRYIHNLVRVSWHDYVCILNRSCIVVIQLYLSLIMSNKLFWSWSWSCIISSSYVNSNWSYSQKVKLGFDLCDLDLWPLTLTFCMDITFVVITPENFMMIRWWEHRDRQMDGRMDWTIHRAAWSQLKTNNKQVRAPIKLTCHWRWQLYISLHFL